MTPLQQLIFAYILLNQPICDKCISIGLGYVHNQNANTPCCKLAELKLILRINGHCERCNRNVILNSINNL